MDTLKDELTRIADSLLDIPVRGADKREVMRELSGRCRSVAMQLAALDRDGGTGVE